jgi:hypothetical protein
LIQIHTNTDLYLSHSTLVHLHHQLSAYGLFFGMINVYMQNYDEIYVQQKGFCYGYNWIVLMVIALQAFGGLLHTLGLKHADNILAAYANSASTIISALASILFFGFKVRPLPPPPAPPPPARPAESLTLFLSLFPSHSFPLYLNATNNTVKLPTHNSPQFSLLSALQW